MQTQFDLDLAQSILQWLVNLKILTPVEAARANELNEQDFNRRNGIQISR